MQELIKRKSMEALGLNGNSRKRIVSNNKVRNWILQGWEYVIALPTDGSYNKVTTQLKNQS